MAVPAPSVFFAPPTRGRRWLRRIRTLVEFLIVLLVSVYLTEQQRGRQTMAAAVARFEAAGESLDPAHFLAREPLKADNFGATPSLDGLMVPTVDGDPPKEIEARMKRFAVIRHNVEILGPEGKSLHRSGRAPRPGGKKGNRNPQPEEPPVPEKAFPNTLPWDEIREMLSSAKSTLKPDPAEPVDVVAVYRALDAERPLFEELSSAASRPFAVLTPAPADRPLFREGNPFPDSGEYTWLIDLARLLRVRILAAAELGRVNEAENLTRVMWKIRELMISEHVNPLTAHWIDCVQAVMRAPATDEPALRVLQLHIPSEWSAEAELLNQVRYHAVWAHLFWERAADTAEWQFSGDFDGAFRGINHSFFLRFIDDTRWAMNSPSGWLRLAGAATIEDKLNDAILPLRTGGFTSLPIADSAQVYEQRLSRPWISPLGLISFFAGESSDCRFYANNLMKVRLTQVSLGAELYRRRNSRYPRSAAELVPEFLPTPPVDLDGQPIRIFSPDETKAVIYSVGWNRTDDCHGIPPAPKEKDSRIDDLRVSLPLPPFPPH